MNELLNIDEISDFLKVRKSTVYSWTHQNRIPHYKIGHHLRFNPVEILEHFKMPSQNDPTMAPRKPNQGSLTIEEDFAGNHRRSPDLSDPFEEGDSYD